MKNCTGIIFDLDGVLVFTDQYHFLAWKSLAERLHIPFDQQVNNRLRGVSRMASLEIILENYTGQVLSKSEKESLAAGKNACYRALLQQMTPASVQPDVRNTLTLLRQRGYRLAVGSSSRNARTILRRTELTVYFDAISDGTIINRSKPDPEVFLKAAAFLGLSPESCAVVEDAPAGIDAAKVAGMFAIGIGSASEYEKTDVSVGTISELPEVFPSLL